ncbi:MAG: RtcB family protein [Magnetococcales bacterium]|nr:RtcB family protein [Magnetococcales bacterium]
MSNFNFIEGKSVPIKAWTRGVTLDENAEQQLHNVASLPFIHKHIAVMPDVHWGRGATVGSVIPTEKAIIPAAVGVDIGCGMMAVQTSLTSKQLPDNLLEIRSAIEKAVPHGRTSNGRPGRDRGAWGNPPEDVVNAWSKMPYRKGTLASELDQMVEKHAKLKRASSINHLGTLGTGNHFIEICLDETDQVWVMLHSGSRGIGNRIGTYFTQLAKKEMTRWHIHLPDEDLAYLPEGADHFYDYLQAVKWAQSFALANREVMMERVLEILRRSFTDFALGEVAVNCHHNYVSKELHFNKWVWVTRKGAVRAGEGEMGIIPGSMGARSYIVRGKGNADSFCSCSHGAGRAMSRTEAKKRFTLEQHVEATEGVECRKDAGVIDETPMAYKDIDAVMAAQADLVEVAHTLKQVLCVKG